MTDQGNGQSNNGRSGRSDTSLILMFLGGALAGAAGAYLAQGRNRENVRTLAGRAQQAVGQLPQATRDASHAAREAFVDAYNSPGEADAPALKPKRA